MVQLLNQEKQDLELQLRVRGFDGNQGILVGRAY